MAPAILFNSKESKAASSFLATLRDYRGSRCGYWRRFIRALRNSGLEGKRPCSFTEGRNGTWRTRKQVFTNFRPALSLFGASR
jgi:hypothetical protein